MDQHRFGKMFKQIYRWLAFETLHKNTNSQKVENYSKQSSKWSNSSSDWKKEKLIPTSGDLEGFKEEAAFKLECEYWKGCQEMVVWDHS